MPDSGPPTPNRRRLRFRVKRSPTQGLRTPSPASEQHLTEKKEEGKYTEPDDKKALSGVSRPRLDSNSSISMNLIGGLSPNTQPPSISSISPTTPTPSSTYKYLGGIQESDEELPHANPSLSVDTSSCSPKIRPCSPKIRPCADGILPSPPTLMTPLESDPISPLDYSGSQEVFKSISPQSESSTPSQEPVRKAELHHFTFSPGSSKPFLEPSPEPHGMPNQLQPPSSSPRPGKARPPAPPYITPASSTSLLSLPSNAPLRTSAEAPAASSPQILSIQRQLDTLKVELAKMKGKQNQEEAETAEEQIVESSTSTPPREKLSTSSFASTPAPFSEQFEQDLSLFEMSAQNFFYVLVVSQVLAAIAIKALFALSYYNYVMFEPYIFSIIWAFLAATALRNTKKRILRRLQKLHDSDRPVLVAVFEGAIAPYKQPQSYRSRRTSFLWLPGGLLFLLAALQSFGWQVQALVLAGL